MKENNKKKLYILWNVIILLLYALIVLIKVEWQLVDFKVFGEFATLVFMLCYICFMSWCICFLVKLGVKKLSDYCNIYTIIISVILFVVATLVVLYFIPDSKYSLFIYESMFMPMTVLLFSIISSLWIKVNEKSENIPIKWVQCVISILLMAYMFILSYNLHLSFIKLLGVGLILVFVLDSVLKSILKNEKICKLTRILFSFVFLTLWVVFSCILKDGKLLQLSDYSNWFCLNSNKAYYDYDSLFDWTMRGDEKAFFFYYPLVIIFLILLFVSYINIYRRKSNYTLTPVYRAAFFYLITKNIAEVFLCSYFERGFYRMRYSGSIIVDTVCLGILMYSSLEMICVLNKSCEIDKLENKMMADYIESATKEFQVKRIKDDEGDEVIVLEDDKGEIQLFRNTSVLCQYNGEDQLIICSPYENDNIVIFLKFYENFDSVDITEMKLYDIVSDEERKEVFENYKVYRKRKAEKEIF